VGATGAGDDGAGVACTLRRSAHPLSASLLAPRALAYRANRNPNLPAFNFIAELLRAIVVFNGSLAVVRHPRIVLVFKVAHTSLPQSWQCHVVDPSINLFRQCEQS
jgi:hypothetical protein